ncbi:MAG: DUF4019 domain-containing protein [Candidatus Competibacter sp.]|nr:DUF4019 domain-containing protein [Candidatus Competibacter sp.]MDS4070469.1 DUF4019 domain-containing protein [Candidatus Competibacter sp.]
MIKILRFGVIFLFLLGSTAHAADNATGKAQTAALAWLALVDAEKYGQSWNEAALLFRSAVMQVDWVNAVTAVRAPLGALKSRTLKSANFTRSLPGAPDGEYVVIQFDSQFEHKASAVETVTPMRDKDGIWRVAGYYIK